MTALCPVIRNEMKVPACRIKTTHIIGAVKTYNSTCDILIIKFTLICFKSLIKCFVGLFLLQLAADKHFFKCSVYLYYIEHILALFSNGLVKLSLERSHIVYVLQINRNITVKEGDIGEGNCFVIGGFLNCAVTESLIHFAVNDDHFTVYAFKCADTRIAVSL